MPAINLTDDELASVTAAIRRTIEDDRFPHAPRLDPLRAALGKFEAAQSRSRSPRRQPKTSALGERLETKPCRLSGGCAMTDEPAKDQDLVRGRVAMVWALMGSGHVAAAEELNKVYKNPTALSPSSARLCSITVSMSS